MRKITEEVITEEGLKLHIIPSKKFKTINIVAKLRAPLERDTITKRALIPYVLRQSTKNYPSQEKLQKKLDNLYGAVLSIDGTKKGNNHIISIRLEVANQKYIVNESSIMDEAVELLQEIIFDPNTDGNESFEPNIFNREKVNLEQKIDAIIDDKMAYANMRLIDKMCENENYAIHVNGYKEDLDSITPENTYAYYQTLLKQDQLDIYILGDFEQKEIKEKVTSLIRKKQGALLVEEQLEPTKKRKNPLEVIEKQNLNQAKLHLGYRTNTTFKNADYAALQVFNGLFGGFPSSKLFINVREKNSLAYYAASRIESHKGLLFVFSGIAATDYEKAREIIELQMTAMKNGDFTDVELTEIKALIVNQLMETLDNPQGIIEMLYQQVIANSKLTPKQLIENIKEVTKNEVIEVANKIEEDTVYLLTSKDGDSDE